MDEAETYRALSHGAYDRLSKAVDRAGEHGHQVVTEHTDESKKRGHTLYEHTDTGDLTLAYRGTSVKRSKLQDLLTDAKLFFGVIPQELREAKKTAQDIAQQYPGRKLTLAGHSLGGTKAIYAGKALGLKSVTHNSFVPVQMSRGLKKYYKATDSEAHVHTSDPIGSAAALFTPRAHTFAYTHETKGDPHGIRGFAGQKGVRLGKKRGGGLPARAMNDGGSG